MGFVGPGMGRVLWGRCRRPIRPGSASVYRRIRARGEALGRERVLGLELEYLDLGTQNPPKKGRVHPVTQRRVTCPEIPVPPRRGERDGVTAPRSWRTR